ACHLLCLLSKELLGDFEACAEMFIPVLFKLVVITVLVIAESADNCIKTIPSSVPGCDYALLILEYWADAPEIQRAADLYEDLIKCCVADAMSEVRSTARTCYRMFTKTWPERSRRLFSSFDPGIQRVINEEEGGVHRRYASPSLRDRGVQSLRTPSQTPSSNVPGYGTSAIVAMDRSATLPSGTPLSSGLVLSKAKSLGKGVDTPSARDPPFSLAVPSSSHRMDSVLVDSTASNISTGSSQSSGLITSDLISAQRPLLRKHVTGRVSANNRNSFDDSQLAVGEMPSYMEGPVSLNDALMEGLSSSSDWSARVSAFNYLRTLLQQGPKGVQEITEFREETVSKTYGIDSLLPALLRSLDEQRSPKAKLAVIEFAINSFNKNSINSERSGNSGILKLWLAKWAPLVHDKNTKLKEAAITSIIAVYSHFDSASVLNFILSLSVEEQNSLRRALKQFTPCIEVDLMNFLQNRRERHHSKSFFDQSDVVGTSSEEGYTGASKKSQIFGRYSAGSVDSEGGRKWNSMQESTLITGSIGHEGSDDTRDQLYQGLDSSFYPEVVTSKSMDLTSNVNGVVENMGLWTTHLENTDPVMGLESSLSTPRLDVNGMGSSGHGEVPVLTLGNGSSELDLNHENLTVTKTSSTPDVGTSIPQILHQICNGSDENESVSKRVAVQQLIDLSVANDQLVWSKAVCGQYFNQILTVVLEVLDDPDSSIRELALSLLVEMLTNQKDSMDNSVEVVLEKLLHVNKDMVAKVSSEAERCLTIVLCQYDPFRCLTVIVPLLVSEDEKTLVTCINCLTKLVGRLSQEELMAQLSSFLPALFDAFGNQSADVRKTVVFCLVDIYIMLGKSFLPYLEGLNSTQLRLVTIYANRISQARSGTTIDANHG
ncbi:hypothetical protein IFM89_026957, partial [Coptis chinensis]